MAEETELDERVDRWLKGRIKGTELYGLTPDLMKSLAEHGYMLYEEGKYDRARVIFEALSAVNNADSHYQKMLGSIYQIQGKLDAAYYHYTQSLKGSSTDINVIANRGEVLLHLKRPREAAEDLKKAIQMDPAGKNPVGRRARILLAGLNVQRWAPPSS